jgi:hypothetical protein
MVASGPKSASKLTRDDVISLVGELDDGTLADILEADATHADVEQALMLLGVVRTCRSGQSPPGQKPYATFW